MYITNGEVKLLTDGPNCVQSVHVGKNDNKMTSGFLVFSFLLKGKTNHKRETGLHVLDFSFFLSICSLILTFFCSFNEIPKLTKLYHYVKFSGT